MRTVLCNSVPEGSASSCGCNMDTENELVCRTYIHIVSDILDMAGCWSEGCDGLRRQQPRGSTEQCECKSRHTELEHVDRRDYPTSRSSRLASQRREGGLWDEVIRVVGPTADDEKPTFRPYNLCQDAGVALYRWITEFESIWRCEEWASKERLTSGDDAENEVSHSGERHSHW